MNSTNNQTDSYQFWDHASTSTSIAFQSQFSPVVEQVIGGVLIIILFITMISLGCTMEVAKIREHLAKPKGVAIAIVAQYGIMPLSAFIFAKIFQLGSMAAMTVLICGCCPGGNLSNIFTLGLQGDMNLRWSSQLINLIIQNTKEGTNKGQCFQRMCRRTKTGINGS